MEASSGNRRSDGSTSPNEAGVDPYAELADTFLRHYDTIRGRVRYELAGRQLDRHLPVLPARVVDIGGGAGHQSVRLAAKGYDVTLVDPSAEMLDQARQLLNDVDPNVRRRVELVAASGEAAPEILADQYDVVLCQGVLMYLEDPTPMIEALAKLSAPGGVISIIAKNRASLAMRSGLEGRWSDALRAINAQEDVGGMGIPTRADDLSHLTKLLDKNGCQVEAWYGIRTFTDHLGNQRTGSDISELLKAEELAGSRDPYRSIARLLHVIARS